MAVRERSGGAVVYRLQRGRPAYLLLHYDAGHWDFPKGHLEDGEDAMQAAVRETREETGISQLEFLPGFRKEIAYFFMRGGRRVHKSVVFFAARTRERRVRLSFEHKGFRWLPFREAEKKVTYANAREVLSAAHAAIEAASA
jgi:8-oxo-dGTP pyrophosphatase MutT (NUDIX family)